ncbi:MAG: PilN domain-containing protein [Methylococcales bacterium]|nr:PilN domain-containing protein [Methylococcales bacterium]
MLNSTLDSLVIKKFFHWWKKELAFLIPSAISRLFNDTAGIVIIQIKDDELYFNFTDHKKQSKHIHLPLNEQGLIDYQQLKLDNPLLEKARVIFRLNKNEGILKKLTLPKAVEENLTQVIAYELDRYTPFNQQQVYYTIKKIAAETDKINLQLILTPKNNLDRGYDSLKSWGINPWLVDYEGMPNNLQDDYEYYNLLPESKRYKANKKALIFQSALIGGIFILLSSILVLPVWFQYQSGQTLDRKIYKIKRHAMEVQELQNKIAVLSEKTDWLIAQKQNYPPLIEILETISQLLKDDTSLTMIVYKNKKLHLTGESPAASTLIKILESSPLFSNADFESTVTKNKTTGLERFRIVVSVNARESDESE